MKRILIISTYPVPYRVELFNELRKKFDVTVFFERKDGDGRSEEYFSNQSWYYVLENNEQAKKAFKKALSDAKTYDICIAYEFTILPAMKLMIKCMKKKIPYAINCDGAILHPNPIKDIIKRFFIKRADLFFSSGKAANNYLEYYGAKPEYIVNNTFTSFHKQDIAKRTLTIEEKSELRKKYGINAKTISIAVGRFIPLKYYDILIKAWKNIEEDNVLYIIGGGEEEERYKEIIEKHHIKNIVLEDFKNKEELGNYYKMADLFIHPTSYDVWGLVINEAMAFGLPIITTEQCVAGVELIQNGVNGYLVEAGNEEIIYKKAKFLLENEKLRTEMGENNLKCINKYTLENSANIITAAICEKNTSKEK